MRNEDGADDLSRPAIVPGRPGLAELAAPGGAAVPGQDGIRPTRRQAGNLWRGLLHNRKATVGSVLLLFFVVLAIFPAQIAPYSPSAQSRFINLPPSAAHLLGTTAFGQDVFSQLIWGARQSVIIAFAAGGIASGNRGRSGMPRAMTERPISSTGSSGGARKP